MITGGAGFIGSNFVLYLLHAHEDIRVVNVDKLTYAGSLDNLEDVAADERHVFVRADICDEAAMAQLFAAHDIDYVVNFAAESHVDRSIESPGPFARTNVEGTVTLLDVARRTWRGGYAGRKFLQVSTDEVYGASPKAQGALFAEDAPLNPQNPYAASKAAADQFVNAHASTYGLPVNIVRCCNNYGPRQHPEKLIPLMVKRALKHEALPIYGDGQQLRDWMHVSDGCRAIDMVLKNGVQGEIYNVGAHDERANVDVTRAVVKAVARMARDGGINGQLIEHVPDRPGHDRRYGIDSSKIGQRLGWKPEIAFAEGLADTVAWYLANRGWLFARG